MLPPVDVEQHSRLRLAVAVLWPSFLVAGLIEMGVFALVDPGDLRGFDGLVLDWSPQAVYTVAFLLFWTLVSGAAIMACVLSKAQR
ncbi:MAG: hypothetical protein JO006_19560 [Paucibacter sp.]|nr:hypothetical protein [Roseateles sp.]